jgi:hypothetical protein
MMYRIVSPQSLLRRFVTIYEAKENTASAGTLVEVEAFIHL